MENEIAVSPTWSIFTIKYYKRLQVPPYFKILKLGLYPVFQNDLICSVNRVYLKIENAVIVATFLLAFKNVQRCLYKYIYTFWPDFYKRRLNIVHGLCKY